MKRIILKVLLALFVAFLIGVPAFVIWMRLGEEEPLDYSALAFELGSQDPEINGYTYLREFCEENQADIPEDYPVKYSEDYDILVDYNLYENWDLAFFEQILKANKEFMAGVEAAFDRPVFFPDREFSPETIFFHVGQLRSYVNLRIIEARVFHLSDQSEAALVRLADLSDEIEIHFKSGGALIGLLTSVALNGVLTAELWVYQANAEFSPNQLKAFAEEYNVAEYYSDAVGLAMRQEFQFLKNVVDDDSQDGAIAYELIPLEEPSRLAIYLQELLLYVGLRKNRTVNEMFEAYLEIIEQAHFPVSERSFDYAKKNEAKASRRDWLVFVNRNPFGHVLLTILYPSMEKVLEVVDRGEASASATRISFALQAYYLERESLPESLDALVPDFLAAIPRDPFDGEPMRYSKEKKIVYSVGNDFVDQRGSERPFSFQMDPDNDYHAAERDNTEPTFPLRFAM